MIITEKFADAFDSLHKEAESRTGLSDFGDTEYHEGMHRILAAIDSDQGWRLTNASRATLTEYIVGILAARLYTQEEWKKNPQYKNVQIRHPLIIVGMIRTGSTALHKMLSVDQQFQSVPAWLFRTPMPRPPVEDWPKFKGFQQLDDQYNALYDSSPEIRNVHEMAAGDAEECIHGLAQSFVDMAMSYFTYSSPSYENWLFRQDMRASYQRYADLLRLIGLNSNRTWLLKNPSHLLCLDTLLDTFPDANIIWTHRDPAKAMVSGTNGSQFWQTIIFDELPLRKEAFFETSRWAGGVAYADTVRQASNNKFYDVKQSDMLKDPMSILSGIYDHFGYEWSDQTQAAMRNWLDQQPAHQVRGHKYDQPDFCVNRETIRELFRAYYARYID